MRGAATPPRLPTYICWSRPNQLSSLPAVPRPLSTPRSLPAPPCAPTPTTAFLLSLFGQTRVPFRCMQDSGACLCFQLARGRWQPLEKGGATAAQAGHHRLWNSRSGRGEPVCMWPPLPTKIFCSSYGIRPRRFTFFWRVSSDAPISSAGYWRRLDQRRQPDEHGIAALVLLPNGVDRW